MKNIILVNFLYKIIILIMTEVYDKPNKIKEYFESKNLKNESNNALFSSRFML